MAYRTSKETQLRKDQKKEFIIQTAARIFSERGYSGTTIKAIVEASQTSVGSFYFYFPNKEHLFEELYDRLGHIMGEVSEFALERSRGIIQGFCFSKTAELWAYENFRGLAKATMIEAAGMNPRFERKRAKIIEGTNERIERVFTKIGQSNTCEDSKY